MQGHSLPIQADTPYPVYQQAYPQSVQLSAENPESPEEDISPNVCWAVHNLPEQAYIQ